MPWLLLLLSAQAADDDAAAYRRSVDSVVFITAITKDWGFSHGAGVVVSAERGLILTAFHVVGDDKLTAAMLPVRGKDGEIVTDTARYANISPASHCRVIARDAGRDLALLQWVTPPPGLKAVPLASRSPPPGLPVFTIGSAAPAMFRYSGGSVRQVYADRWTFATGQEVSARVIEMTVPINPGDSGGAVINRAGEIVGISSAVWKNANQVQKGIDVTEIKAFLGANHVR